MQVTFSELYSLALPYSFSTLLKKRTPDSFHYSVTNFPSIFFIEKQKAFKLQNLSYAAFFESHQFRHNFIGQKKDSMIYWIYSAQSGFCLSIVQKKKRNEVKWFTTYPQYCMQFNWFPKYRYVYWLYINIPPFQMCFVLSTVSIFFFVSLTLNQNTIQNY